MRILLLLKRTTASVEAMTMMALILVLLTPGGVKSFSPSAQTMTTRRQTQSPRSTILFADADDSSYSSTNIIDHSTIALLGQIGLKTPSPDYILDFHLFLLGCGQVSGTPWHFKCGDDASQQFAYQIDPSTTINGGGQEEQQQPLGNDDASSSSSIGLRFASLEGLKKRLAATIEDAETCCIQSFDVTEDHVKIVDRYGTVYYCRQDESSSDDDDTSVLGFAYVEWNVPIGTAAKIAQFYDSVFDATTTVMNDGTTMVALIGIGPVEESGKAAQYLIFREESEDSNAVTATAAAPLLSFVTLHVGQNAADFNQCYKNCNIAGLLSGDNNKTSSAKPEDEFTFDKIIDIETGELLVTLEHKIRSVKHEAFPKSS